LDPKEKRFWELAVRLSPICALTFAAMQNALTPKCVELRATRQNTPALSAVI